MPADQSNQNFARSHALFDRVHKVDTWVQVIDIPENLVLGKVR
jgi:hypothetical protein